MEQQNEIIEKNEQQSQITSKTQLLIDNIETVIKGKRSKIEMIVSVLLARGHILLEDNPGTGKTLLARTLAQSIATNNVKSLQFKRIQFTPDLLPMDLIGSHIFDDSKKDFVFKKGPLFCNVLLADEINRASPKVQSALLESMAENQISIGDVTYKLQDLFFTIATQNPIETEGTYPLPEAQLDRFFMKLSLGYVDDETEADIYRNYLKIDENLHAVKQIMDLKTVLKLQAEVDKIYVHDEIISSIRNIVAGTRNDTNILLPCSTRSGIIFLKCLKAFAFVNNRTFVIEDDIKTLAHSVLHHRIIFKNNDARKKALAHLVDAEITRLARLKIYQHELLEN
ncbi:MAG: MoxR family ATPase [Prevotellaceae bacterium]|jgi:MoxR-like ATPase|nr:MoxR family ATPase [Prevotellaceae bacterium]